MATIFSPDAWLASLFSRKVFSSTLVLVSAIKQDKVHWIEVFQFFPVIQKTKLQLLKLNDFKPLLSLKKTWKNQLNEKILKTQAHGNTKIRKGRVAK